MSTSILDIANRVKDILTDHLAPGDEFAPADDVPSAGYRFRPVTAFRVGKDIPSEEFASSCPVAYVVALDDDPIDQYTGSQTMHTLVTVTFIENLLDTDDAYETVVYYAEVCRDLVFRLYRRWKRSGDSDLGIITTYPGPIHCDTVEAEDLFLWTGQVSFTVERIALASA